MTPATHDDSWLVLLELCLQRVFGIRVLEGGRWKLGRVLLARFDAYGR